MISAAEIVPEKMSELKYTNVLRIFICLLFECFIVAAIEK
jgi:hypothetical protein